MKVRVLFFASLRERLGSAEASWDLGDGASVGDLWSALCQAHPSLGELAGRVSFAVNREYAGKDHVLAPGDQIALIPPVSGG